MAIKLKIQTNEAKLKVAKSDKASFTVSEGVPIYPNPYTGPTEVTPTEEEQTLSTNGLMMTDDVKVEAIDSTYVGSNVPRQDELSINGLTVTAEAGYYENDVSETVSIPSGSLSVNAEAGYTTIDDARKWRFRPVTYVNTAGFFQQGNHYGSYATYDAIPTGTTVTPSTSSQTIGATNTMLEGAVTVAAMPGITLPTMADPTTPVGTKKATINYQRTADRYLNIPTGYNPTEQYYEIKGVPSGEVQLPDTIAGTGATVSFPAANTIELSGTYSASPRLIEQGYISSVSPSSVFLSLQAPLNSRSSSDLEVSGPTVTAPAGYYASAASKSIGSGSVTAPATITGTNAATSTSTNTLTLSTIIPVTPVVSTAGYVSAGTERNVDVSVSADMPINTSSSLQVSGATVTAPAGYYASNASATVASGTAGTPTASKSNVADHSLMVIPEVVNTTGYITGGTKTGMGVTVSASELVSGSETKTQNGTYNVENLAELVVNVSGGGGGLTKIGTLSIGNISTSSTQAADTGKSLELAVSAYSGYDMLICVCHTSTHTNGRHVATIRVVNFSATSAVSTKTSTQIATSTQHWKLSSGGTMTMRSGTTPYGVYVNAATLSTSSPQTLTLTIYQRYNSTSTGTINGNYVLDVYGVKIQDYI